MKQSPEELEREVASIRKRLDPVVSELDHRRHQLTSLVGRRGPAIMKGVAALAATFAVVKLIQKKRARTARKRSGVLSAFGRGIV